MIRAALILLATAASIPAFAQSTPGVPFGTRCPVALPLGTTFLNTASAPTGTTVNIWDGAQCVPWMGLNQTAHTLTLGSTSNRFTNVYGVLGNFSGDLTTDITGSTQCVVANVSGVLSGAGSTCAPGYTPSALTRTSDTNVTLTLGGTPATALLQAASITAGWSGTLAVARGGTGGGSASGTLLDNIAGFASTGFLTRTGSGTYAFQSATNGVVLGNLAQSGANTMLGNWTGSLANVAANSMPSCADSGGNHLNYVSGTGITCGTGVGNGITALTGDVTATGPGSVAATLATVNSNVGTFGSASAIPGITVNGKGLITAVSMNSSINAAQLGGATFSAPGAIGGGTPAAGTFTTLAGNTSVTTPLYNLSVGGTAAGGTITADSFVGMKLRPTAGSSFGVAVYTTGGTIVSGYDGTGNFLPGSNNAFTNGASGSRWSNVFSVLGDFSGSLTNGGITSDVTHTDASVCEDTTTHTFYSGSGTLGICLGTSGRQFKTAFTPMTAGLAEIMQINLWNYRYKPGHGDNGVRVQFGPTAQDIEAIPALSSLVGHNQEGEAINYDVGALLPIALRAIQELKAEIQTLKKRHVNAHSAKR